MINKLQHARFHETYHLMEQEISGVADINKFAKWMLGPRVCVTGLIEQKNISGFDAHALAQQGIVPHLHRSEEPSRVVQDRDERSDLSAKNGLGFYDWSGRDIESYKARAEHKLQQLIHPLKNDG